VVQVPRIIGDHNSIVTSFHGDSVLATCNVPVEDANHARNALAAACAVLACTAERSSPARNSNGVVRLS
jgi:hypothetical protein